MKGNLVTIERIIAKMDNDFNFSESDWIPRVGAWTIDAMNLLKVFDKKTIRRKTTVRNRIAYSEHNFDVNTLRVYDENKKIIHEADRKEVDESYFSTGEYFDNDDVSFDDCDVDYNNIDTTKVVVNEDVDANNEIYVTRQSKDYNSRYNVLETKNIIDCKIKNYVVLDCNKIELNYDAKFVYIESREALTYYSDNYNCDLPLVPNNGYVLEAIISYCLYKMLCRGYKHPVFNLRDNSPAINPYIAWTHLKDKAKVSLTIDRQGDDITKGIMRSNMFIEMFGY